MITNTLSNIAQTISDPDSSNNIYLLDEIYQSTINDVIKKINDINEKNELEEKKYQNLGHVFNRKPIKLYISSYGGSVYDGLGLIGVIQNSKTPIHAIAIGKVMSMGFLIACTAHKTYAYKYTTFMYHAISSWTYGQIQKIKEDYKELSRLQEIIDGIVTSETSISKSRLTEVQKSKFDWFFDTEEALALKVIDEIL